MFAPGSGSVVVVAVALLVVVAALASPAGRRAALGSVGRWPALIRAEMRGDAPLSDGRADTADDRRVDTTPEMPAVRAEPLPPTSTFPQVRRPGG